MSSKLEKLSNTVKSHFGDKLTRLDGACGQLVFEVAAQDLRSVCLELRDGEGIKLEMLIDLCGVDYLHYGQAEWNTGDATSTGFGRGVDVEEGEGRHEKRFAVVYQLMSVSLNHRLRLKVYTPDSEPPIIDSVNEIWPSANWYEREAFDLFGILFDGHPDLRRLLTDYGFIGHPFRKDFPLIGNVEVRYDPDKGRVIYEAVSIEPRVLVPKVIRRDRQTDENPGAVEQDG
jgi:NADH-quinone oxidoreductase subunit C